MPVEVTGTELRANADAWRGSVRAALVDATSGQPLPGYTMDECLALDADEIDQPLRWKGNENVSELSGKSVRVRFSVLNAELYAFWFAG